MINTIYNVLIKIVGFLLITPAIISVFLFIIQLYTPVDNSSSLYYEKNVFKNFILTGWTSDMQGATSALPFYFGLMAIAGAYLIKDTQK